MKPTGPAIARATRCPRCRVAVAWSGNPHRPFCSLSCRLIDLGVWIEGRYRIPGPGLRDDSAEHDGVASGGG